MKFYLKKDWAEQSVYQRKKHKKRGSGYFVGRKQEISHLKHIIKNNHSGSTLVAGVRGFGKTSFVHKVFDEITREPGEEIYPVFVNIGSILSLISRNENSGDENKKLLLVSLIRALYLQWSQDPWRWFKGIAFTEYRKLKKVYEKSLGSYSIEKNSVKQFGVKAHASSAWNIVTPAAALALLPFLKNSDGDLHVVVLSIMIFFGTLFVAGISKQFSRREALVIENSTEYLEIEFENWLARNKKKIIFVIDELDKIKAGMALHLIKECKNLFTRSFTHFIFITNERAFDQVSNSSNRTADVNRGGTFPTLFTNILYLPLPSTTELREYLNDITDETETQKNYLREAGTLTREQQEEALIGHLLFHSGCDFFPLKRVISDCIQYESKNPYIDTKYIEGQSTQYRQEAKLTEYTEIFLRRYRSNLKGRWKENSELQQNIFQFLRDNFGHNFNFKYDQNESDEDATEAKRLIDFCKFLRKIGTLYTDPPIGTDEPMPPDIACRWNYTFKRDPGAYKTEFDISFLKKFQELVKVANELHSLEQIADAESDLPEDNIIDGNDGRTLTGISLFDVFNNHLSLKNKIGDDAAREETTVEDANGAMERITQNLENVYSMYFNVLIGYLNITLSNIVMNDNIDNSSLSSDDKQSLRTMLNHTGNMCYIYEIPVGQQHRYSIVVGIEENPTNDLLNWVHDRRYLLVMSIDKKGEDNSIKPMLHPSKKEKKIENFIECSWKDFKYFTEIYSRIKKHFTEQ